MMEINYVYYYLTIRKHKKIRTLRSALKRFKEYEKYITWIKYKNIGMKIKYYFEHTYEKNGDWYVYVKAICKYIPSDINSLPKFIKSKNDFNISFEECEREQYYENENNIKSKEYILNEIKDDNNNFFKNVKQ